MLVLSEQACKKNCETNTKGKVSVNKLPPITTGKDTSETEMAQKNTLAIA